MSCLLQDPALCFPASEAPCGPSSLSASSGPTQILPADSCRPRAPARGPSVWARPRVRRDSFGRLMRRGFGDTGSIPPSPNDNEKETTR